MLTAGHCMNRTDVMRDTVLNKLTTKDPLTSVGTAVAYTVIMLVVGTKVPQSEEVFFRY